MTDLLKAVEVIFEDEAALVVNKPAGLVVHSDGRTDEPNLCDWILEHYPDTAGVGEPIERDDASDIKRPGIVHRLDRDTSGALIIARTDEAYAHIKKQFKERSIQKRYNAFVSGRIKNREFSVDEPLGRSSGDDFRKMAVAPYVRGKTRPAQTDFKLIQSSDEASFLEAYPLTGRTHQIRVHLKSLHHPIICDPLYASGKDCILGFSRQALHARSISFRLPGGMNVGAEAELPADFKQALKELERLA